MQNVKLKTVEFKSFTLFWDLSAQGGTLFCNPAKGKQNKTPHLMQKAFCLLANYLYILIVDSISAILDGINRIKQAHQRRGKSCLKNTTGILLIAELFIYFKYEQHIHKC